MKKRKSVKLLFFALLCVGLLAFGGQVFTLKASDYLEHQVYIDRSTTWTNPVLHGGTTYNMKQHVDFTTLKTNMTILEFQYSNKTSINKPTKIFLRTVPNPASEVGAITILTVNKDMLDKKFVVDMTGFTTFNYLQVWYQYNSEDYPVIVSSPSAFANIFNTYQFTYSHNFILTIYYNITVSDFINAVSDGSGSYVEGYRAGFRYALEEAFAGGFEGWPEFSWMLDKNSYSFAQGRIDGLSEVNDIQFDFLMLIPIIIGSLFGLVWTIGTYELMGMSMVMIAGIMFLFAGLILLIKMARGG